MKRIIWVFATLPMLAMLAASCANERVESAGDAEKVIAFKTVSGKQTLSRAEEINTGALQTASKTTPIVVKAYEDGDVSTTPYMTFSLKYQEYINPAYTTTGWGYADDPEFHPDFDLVYYSNVPTVALNASSNGVSASFDYTVPVAGSQVDLIAATATTNNDSQDDATAELLFGHILSQVNFAVVGLDGVKITIEDIEVSGVKNEGTYTFGATGWGATAAVDAGVSNTYAYTPAGDNFTDMTDAVLYLGNTGDIGADKDNGNDNALMLMPQTFTKGGGAVFTFDYEMENAAGTDLGSGTATVDLGDLGTTAWEPGKRYLYKMIFQSPVYILFDVDVEDWVDGSVIEVDVE